MVRKVDGFINEINRIALLNEVTQENKWLVNNGIYFASRLGSFTVIQIKV